MEAVETEMNAKGYKKSTTHINKYVERTIIIDFLDPENKLLFGDVRGSGFGLDNLSKREERLQVGLKEILAQYPQT